MQKYAGCDIWKPEVCGVTMSLTFPPQPGWHKLCSTFGTILFSPIFCSCSKILLLWHIDHVVTLHGVKRKNRGNSRVMIRASGRANIYI